MKSKILFFLAATALVTLSFTFGVKSKQKNVDKPLVTESPIGGFAMEDKAL